MATCLRCACTWRYDTPSDRPTNPAPTHPQIWLSSREEVPYTLRKHAILVTCDMERALGRETFKQVGGCRQCCRSRAGALLHGHQPAPALLLL